MSTYLENSTFSYTGFIKVLYVSLLLTLSSPLTAQVGPVIWEDNFNTLNQDIWTSDTGDGCDIGLCGWGNQELESYQPANVYIAQVPGEPGNNALVLEAKRENAGSRVFTSGKVTTNGNLAIQYGLIEVRVRVPDLNTGLWPAAWMLGTTNLAWPAKGEIDMMEMGFSQAARNEQQEPNSTVNTYVGANAFFPIPGGGAGSIAYDVDYNQPYVASNPLNNRFVTYRIYWEPTQIRFTVVDGSVEHDLYTNPLPIDPDGVTAAFTRPFYMLLNLAVGGTLPGTLSNEQVTAPLPGKMYIDYVRVSQWNGYGSVETNYGELTAETGDFGVYTDQTPTTNHLVIGSDAEIYAWGETLEAGTIPAYEGSNVISWKTKNPNSWFGGGIVALNGKDMSNYTENGSLKFKIKIPGDVSFKIGLTDNYTNEKYIEFPAGQTKYGLVRNGEWGQVEIPLADYTGLLAFQNIGYMFTIVSIDGQLPTSIFQFAIDDIVWEDGNASNAPVVSNISLSPANSTALTGQQVQFQANALDQFGNPIATTFNWTASGGSISSSGLFSSNSTGTYTVSASSGSVDGTTTITVNPQSTGITLPGTFQAEDYNEGGQGVGYNDSSAGNTGGGYRTDDVDIEATRDASGGYNVGWITAGEWLNYTVNISGQPVGYNIGFRVASPNGNGQFHLEADGANITGTLTVPATGGWQNYVTVTAPNIAISQGSHTLRLVFDSDGFNINYVEVDAVTPTQPSCTLSAPNGDYTVQISEDSSNPTLTFIPQNAGIGNPTCLLYYSTDNTTTFPGYGVSPNSPFTINASAGQTVYLYYTYSVPEGGERNTAGSIQSFTVGACGMGSRSGNTVGEDSKFGAGDFGPDLRVYPNPGNGYVMIDMADGKMYETLTIYSAQGALLKNMETHGKSSLRIDISDLPSGIYLAVISGKKGQLLSRIVK